MSPRDIILRERERRLQTNFDDKVVSKFDKADIGFFDDDDDHILEKKFFVNQLSFFFDDVKKIEN